MYLLYIAMEFLLGGEEGKKKKAETFYLIFTK
jgi:hypothetical protein